MTDISKCDGERCPRKEQCYRYTAKDGGKWQSWFSSPPTCEDECNDFWPIVPPAENAREGEETK
jgi:hypothetical protein